MKHVYFMISLILLGVSGGVWYLILSPSTSLILSTFYVYVSIAGGVISALFAIAASMARW